MAMNMIGRASANSDRCISRKQLLSGTTLFTQPMSSYLKTKKKIKMRPILT